MLSSRRVRALTASLLLAVATFVVVVPSAALWEPPTTTAAPALDTTTTEGATAHPHVLRSEAAISASEALPQRGAPTWMWWLVLLTAFAALSPLVAPRATATVWRQVPPHDAVVGCGPGTRAPPHLL